MLIHLGMSGSVRIYPHHDKAPSPEKHDHMVIDLLSGQRLILNDPRRFGGVDLLLPREEGKHPLLKQMGIEPLGNRLDGEFMHAVMKAKATPIKTALLDQRIIAGIGNIYASEALFLAGIHPARKAGRISRGAVMIWPAPSERCWQQQYVRAEHRCVIMSSPVVRSDILSRS